MQWSRKEFLSLNISTAIGYHQTSYGSRIFPSSINR
jgi:hypothetical protein